MIRSKTRFRTTVSAGLLAASLALTPSPAAAQPAAYQIRDMSLSRALREFGRISGRQIIFTEDLVRGRRAPEIRGTYTPEAALDRLLDGSGLRAETTPAGAIMILRASPGSGEDMAGGAAADSGSADAATATPDILVVGRLTLNADIRRSEDDSQPYIIIDRQELERTGASSVEDALRRALPMETSSVSANQSPSEVTRSTIRLRGLSELETLILVDGRRLSTVSVAGTTTQADVSGIPLAAIERIEVLPSTSASQYGGGATGGVINIVLRRDFSGVEARATVEATDGGGATSRRLDVSAGHTLNDGRTSLMVNGSISRTAALSMRQRDFYANGLRRVIENNPSAILGTTPPLAATTNISSTTGAILTLKPAFGGASLGAPRTFVPYGYAGPASDNAAGLIANAGLYNLDLANTAQEAGGGNRSLLAGSENWSINATIRHVLSDWLTVFAEASAGQSESSFDQNAASPTFTLLATSPANPFNQNIRVSVPAVGTDFEGISQIDSYRVLIGGIADLGRGWRLSADFTWSLNEWTSRESLGLDATRATAAIRSGALNIFRDVNAFPTDFAAYTFAPDDYGPNRSTSYALAARASGPLSFVSLPGGHPTMTLVAEGRREVLGEYVVDFPAFGILNRIYRRSQDAAALYGEIVLPFIGRGNAVPGVDLLELRFAGRFEHYRQTGSNQAPDPEIRYVSTFSSVDPTVSLRYAPSPDITFRASYGTGFLPPQLGQLADFPVTVEPFTVVVDPLRGNEAVANVISSGTLNAQLRPERSESFSAGFVLTPRVLPEFRLSMDWTRIRKTDAIRALAPLLSQDGFETLLTYFPERITRNTNPATFGGFGLGPITAVDQSLVNISRNDLEAIDINFNYELALGNIGDVTLYANATYALQNEVQIAPDAPIDDLLGRRAQLKWRGNGGVEWRRGSLSIGWNVQYFDGYYLTADRTVFASQGSARVSSQVYHDIAIRYRLPGPGLLAGAEIGFNVVNLFNEAPPFVASRRDIGFYSTFGDARGRLFRLGLRRAF